jgi:LDH2 family malate/lactate/ureidoglycolate dehydrogenase
MFNKEEKKVGNYEAGVLRSFAQQVLRKLGTPPGSSEIIADTLVRADLRGIHSHGIGKLDNYTARVEAKVLDPAADITIGREQAATAVMNANNGFGQIAAYRAMEKAIQMASSHGIGLVLVNNSNHFGIASYYSLMAAGKNMIGVVTTNASPGIAPFGAKEKLLGTNPFSVAIPSKSRFPIVLDMSSSVVARGKVRQALKAGEQIPRGWALDSAGMPTTDPAEALKGTLEPICGPKGSGFALIIEILCGILSGSCMPGDVRVITDTSGPCGTGHLFCCLAPGAFTDSAEFLLKIDETIDRVKNLPAISGEIFLPGEIEYLHELKGLKEGIALKDTVVKALKVLSGHYAIPF